MRALLRPRFWLSLLFGGAVAALAWRTLPPMPTRTVDLTAQARDVAGATHHLTTITSDGRYLITSYARPFENGKRGEFIEVRIWDVHRSPPETILRQPGPNDSCTVSILLSKAENTLVVSFWDGMRKNHTLHAFDFPTCRQTRQVENSASVRVALGSDGELLLFSSVGVSEVETGRVRFRFAEEIPGFQFQYFTNDLAYFRKDKFGWLYRLSTGEKHGPFPIPDAHFRVSTASGDGRIIVGHVASNEGGGSFQGQLILDRASGDVFPCNDDHIEAISADGETMLLFRRERSRWLRMLTDLRPRGARPLVSRWKTSEPPVAMGGLVFADFSRQGNILVVRRRDDIFEIHELPLRTAWPHIAFIGLAGFSGAWLLGWGWTRWRGRHAKSRQTPRPAASANPS